MTYHAMMAASPLIPSRSNRGIQVSRKINLISLPFQPQVLNFRANMGISATSNQLLIKIPAKIIYSALGRVDI